jgi:DNA-directed RNA polymerase specialized sigma24 family protein
MAPMKDTPAIADLIAEARRGDPAALDEILRVLYDDLYALASARLEAGDRDQPLDTAELVHESYLRFEQTGNLKAEDRPHFFDYAGRIIPTVMGDFSR